MDVLALMLIAVVVAAAAYLWFRFPPNAHSASADDPEVPGVQDSRDPIAEADRRMKYGLYDDAAAFVRRSIQPEPTRHDLKAKLFEVLFVWGKADQFRQAGKDYGESLRAEPEWQSICIMASQLCPEDRTFQ